MLKALASFAVLVILFAGSGCEVHPPSTQTPVVTITKTVPPTTTTTTTTENPPDSTPTTTPNTNQPAIQNRGSCNVGQMETADGCKPCAQLKPCYYAASEMHDMVQNIYPGISQFSQSVYGNAVPPVSWFVVATGTMMPSMCGPLKSLQALLYCPASNTIYLGEDALWRVYNSGDRGDAVVFVVMAHEFGHRVQAALGGQKMVQGQSQADTIKLENQADCFSGAVAKYMAGQGYFSTDDLSGVESFIPQVADSDSDPNRNHGTAQQREGAFVSGYALGLESCDAFGINKISPNK